MGWNRLSLPRGGCILTSAGAHSVYNDALGLLLEHRRATAVLPHVRGRLLDVGCGSNQLVRRYGDGMGVDVTRGRTSTCSSATPRRWS